MPAVTIDKAKLNAGMTATANAIRAKTGGSASLPWDYANGTGFSAAVDEIQASGDPVTTQVTITENGVYSPPSGVDGYNLIIVGVTIRSPRADPVISFDFSTNASMSWPVTAAAAT